MKICLVTLRVDGFSIKTGQSNGQKGEEKEKNRYSCRQCIILTSKASFQLCFSPISSLTSLVITGSHPHTSTVRPPWRTTSHNKKSCLNLPSLLTTPNHLRCSQASTTYNNDRRCQQAHQITTKSHWCINMEVSLLYS